MSKHSRAIDHISSRYNFHVPMGDGALLYNANTGAVLQLSGADGLLLAGALSRLNATVSREQLPDEVYQHLIAGGFLLPAQTDELAGIRERYWRAR